jgi:hypothetical protein
MPLDWNQYIRSFESDNDFDNECQNVEMDVLMEEILNNLNNTSVGKVLKKIAKMPQERKDKIIDVREQITKGRYEVEKRLDIAIEKVLKELGE